MHQLHTESCRAPSEALQPFPQEEPLTVWNLQLRGRQPSSASGLGIAVLRKSASFCALRGDSTVILAGHESSPEAAFATQSKPSALAALHFVITALTGKEDEFLFPLTVF